MFCYITCIFSYLLKFFRACAMPVHCSKLAGSWWWLRVHGCTLVLVCYKDIWTQGLTFSSRRQFAQIPRISIHHAVANPRWRWHCECAPLIGGQRRSAMCAIHCAIYIARCDCSYILQCFAWSSAVIARCVQFTARCNSVIAWCYSALLRVKQCSFHAVYEIHRAMYEIHCPMCAILRAM